MTTTIREGTERELYLDQQAMRVTCKACGSLLVPDHGIITLTADPPVGVKWWQCTNPDCKRRIKEEYEYRVKKDNSFSIFTKRLQEV